MNPLLADIRAVFFDAVGTLLFPSDSVAETYASIAHRQGVQLEADKLRHDLRTAYEQQERLDHAAGWKTDEARERDRWHAIVTSVFRDLPDPEEAFHELWEWYTHPSAWKAHPQTADVLQALHDRGLILGMGSNFDARLVSLVEQMPVFAPLRERCVVSSLVGSRKPGKAFFDEVIRLAGCAPEAILFVGDDPRNDYEGARSAGLRPVLLDLSGKPANPPQTIANLSELL